MPTNDFDEHCRKIAERFLLTAVVVDDRPFFRPLPSPTRAVRPTRQSVAQASEPKEPRKRELQDLDVAALTDSFARHGMVCGVIVPDRDLTEETRSLDPLGQADILILDWQLHGNNGRSALELLTFILGGGRGNRLRLIAVYTGEPGLLRIREKIVNCLEGLDELGHRVEPGEADCEIAFGPCRIVIYAKPNTPTPGLGDRSVEEADLPNRLVGDFTTMVDGLLPGLVLTALTAVRENVYRVLERFDRELDPAFLAHRACLPVPSDSEQHIVEQVASELHGVMDDAILTHNPAGLDPIHQWLVKKTGGGKLSFGQGKEMTVAQTVDLLTEGIKKANGPLSKNKDYANLSCGFSLGAENSRALDRRLASAMCFRMVLDEETRILWMGTVLERREKEELFLCVTPKCDSVRLETCEASFLLLPLLRPPSGTPQLVLPPRETETQYERATICTDPSRWETVSFKVNGREAQCVVAEEKPGGGFSFRDVADGHYDWVGELKAEFAQTVAQGIAERLSRVPLNKSEWLRRSER